jgi:hypothetical protein
VKIIVARGESDLFEYLNRRFEEIPDVRILVDRRDARAPEVGRHAADRRHRSDADEHLRSHGYVIIREPHYSSPNREVGHIGIEG